jgi:hypothetical protein
LCFTRKPNDFDFRDRLVRGLLGGGDYKIADGAALNFSGTPDNRESLTRDAGFQAGGSVASILRHKSAFEFEIFMMYGILPYKVNLFAAWRFHLLDANKP